MKNGLTYVAALYIAMTLPASLLAQVGRDWGVQGKAYIDDVTGIRVYELTSAPARSDNLYYHFSNFTADNRNLIFASTLAGEWQLFRADVSTWKIFQLTEGPDISSRSGCPDPSDGKLLYYLRGPEVFAIDVTDFRAKKLGEIPPPRLGMYQQPSVSHDGEWLALSKQRDENNWEIGLLNIASGAYRPVITQGFRITHVQHSPTEPVIFYVWETGGYAPQRSWLVNIDGSSNRPFYFRTKPDDWFTPLKEWVTHESWIAETGEMLMVNDRQGIMTVKTDGASTMITEGRYWHAAARSDGRFIVIDDFDGRVWLMETASGNRRLLATGTRAKERVHAHPSFDRRGDFVQFHSGRTHETVAVIDLRKLPPLRWR